MTPPPSLDPSKAKSDPKSDQRCIQNYSSPTEPKRGEENNMCTQNPISDENLSYSHWLDKVECKNVAYGTKKKRLALTWRNLEVTGIDSRAVIGQNILSLINPVELLRNSKPLGTVVSWSNNAIVGIGTNIFSSTDNYKQNERTAEARGNGTSFVGV